MRVLGKIFLGIILLTILAPVLLLGYFGFIPGVSTLFGSNKPRDLGIKYSEAHRASARDKTKVKWTSLPANTAPEVSIQRFGSHEASIELSSQEATSLMNNRPWKYFPYANVQVKFGDDGSAQVSGTLIKDRLPGYAAAIGIPTEAVNFAMKFLPVDPVFYLKIKAELGDNRVTIFEPQKFEIGRVPIPIDMFLSFAPKFTQTVFAVDVSGMASELSQVTNKKALIISYINGRLAGYSSFFYAKHARAGDNKLIFEGRLPQTEATVQ